MTTLSRADQDPRAGAARATMRDVAALAGVSLKTVSRVVNREPGVSADLVARVDRAAEQLDYRPNLTASNLRRSDQRTGTLALLVEDVANEFFAQIHRGVEDVARERGVVVMAASVDRDPARERDLVAAFASRRVDGLILAPTAKEQGYLEAELRRGWPVVAVDRVPRGIEIDAVVTDNEAGAMTAVRHLATAGHQDIAFIGGLSTLSTAVARRVGYLEAMAEANAASRPEWIAIDVHDEQQAQAIAERMLAQERRPTAFFTAQNLITMGVVRALRARGLRDSVALVGFDDFALADMIEPAVSVVSQDVQAIGRRSAELLFARLDGVASEPATHVVPSRLIVRGSGEISPR